MCTVMLRTMRTSLTVIHNNSSSGKLPIKATTTVMMEKTWNSPKDANELRDEQLMEAQGALAKVLAAGARETIAALMARSVNWAGDSAL